MLSYQTFVNTNQLHDQIHIDFPELTKEAKQQRQIDESCIICYPPIVIINRFFKHFWNWFYITFPATSFSSRTYLYFYQYARNPTYYRNSIEKLLLSIRYSEPVHFDRLLEETITAFGIYYSFVFDPADIDIIQPSPSLDIPFSTQPNIDNLFEETSSNSSEHIFNTPSTISENDYFSDFEEFNLDLLFHENIMAATPHDILNYLRSGNNNQILHIEPFFGDGTQDPLTWWVAFTKARKSNRWQEAKAYQMFAAYLQDEANDWWTTYVTTNGNDFNDDTYR
jgi:hypothetical protein